MGALLGGALPVGIDKGSPKLGCSKQPRTRAELWPPTYGGTSGREICKEATPGAPLCCSGAQLRTLQKNYCFFIVFNATDQLEWISG